MEDFGFCRECGKVKEDKSLTYCKSCTEKNKDNYKQLKAYLKNYPQANAIQIARETDIKIEKIMEYVREGLINVNSK